MPDGVPQKLRQEAGHLLAKTAAKSDGDERNLASRTLAPAQSAEAAEQSPRQHRGTRPQTSGNSGLDENLKLVAEANLGRFIGCLYVETDKAQREIYRNLLTQEQRWFAAGEERAEVLERLFRECIERVQRQKSLLDTERAAGLDVTRNEMLLNNMLQTRAMLRELLLDELRRD